jgi:hypothetical protein
MHPVAGLGYVRAFVEWIVAAAMGNPAPARALPVE